MSDKPTLKSILSVSLILTGLAIILICGLMGLSLSVGALLNWLVPTFSWESASLMAAIAIMGVSISVVFAINAIAIQDRTRLEYTRAIREESDRRGMHIDDEELEELAMEMIYSQPIRAAGRDWVVGPLRDSNCSPANQPPSQKRRGRKK